MLKQWIYKLFHKSVPLYCPVCNAHPDKFLPLPEYYLTMWKTHHFPYIEDCEMTPLETYFCPNCGASDRERLYALWIKQQIETKQFQQGTKLIHFAPESVLANWLKNLNLFDYNSADLMMDNVDYQIDITAMSFENEQFDFFICSHILEHVDSDDKALSELYRILKKQGSGILMVPIAISLKKTLEDTTLTDIAKRWQLFGQDDHVRLYAHDDYIQKLKQHGFYVEQLGQDYFGISLFQSLGLKPTSILYIVRRYEH